VERLSFRVLGPLSVGGATGEVLVPGSRRRTLLIRLLMSANEVIPAQRLVEDVWDGAPPPAPRPRSSHTCRGYAAY
jgi:DNA-binding SARP family transcriptional activator